MRLARPSPILAIARLSLLALPREDWLRSSLLRSLLERRVLCDTLDSFLESESRGRRISTSDRLRLLVLIAGIVVVG